MFFVTEVFILLIVLIVSFFIFFDRTDRIFKIIEGKISCCRTNRV